MDTWDAIQTERAALVDALAELPPETWDQQSLCTGWTNRQVLGHLIATATMTPPAFLGKMIASGFRFPAMTVRDIERTLAGRSDADLVEAYRSRVTARTAPPGPPTSWLGETIVHGEDIFRSLGSYREHPDAHLRAVADFYSGSNLLIGSKTRIAGVRLEATDSNWSHGDGPAATGPAVALVMAMTGRKPALNDLTGDGVAVLRARP
jgi:uncharacterized protein (TIGR03083 family)